VPQTPLVNQPPRRLGSGAPHNPWLRELVSGKQRWSGSLSTEDMRQGFRGWHERGYLPHRDEPGLIQFVTFRLADSFPRSPRSEWEHLWKIEDDRKRRKELEAYLDRGRGSCYLQNAKVAALVEDSLRHFDGQRYELNGWVVMPNHVHVLFRVTATPMAQVVESWKKFTSHEANKLLGLRGQLWQEDYWDTYMRDAAHELKSRRYIECNPVKAKLVMEARSYGWSSARFRDEFGNLKLH
jgi:REP element-mobilizing transposase RayT